MAFWPDDKGRDGCRTPMVWDDAPHGGFSEGRPWLPVKPPQARRSVAAQLGREGSPLETYRAALAFRRGRPELARGDIAFEESDGAVLAFTRRLDGSALRCRFNLSPEPVAIGDAGGAVGPSAGHADGRLEPWGFVFEEA